MALPRDDRVVGATRAASLVVFLILVPAPIVLRHGGGGGRAEELNRLKAPA